MNPRFVWAFDCFGTVFDMADVSKKEIKAYVNHVRKPEWSEYQFPPSWYSLRAHADAAEGIRRLQSMGDKCWAFSNGNADLIEFISRMNGIYWDEIVDLSIPKVYKPNDGAYEYLRELNDNDGLLQIVTANPTFGDVEGAASIGVKAHVIRHGKPETIIELAEMFKL